MSRLPYTCTFFGHRDTPYEIKPKVKTILKILIDIYDVKTFYVGNQGNFDSFVKNVLEELLTEYADIRYYVVLAYMPKVKNGYKCLDNTIFPNEIETIPPKYAIIKRNKWMIAKADYVVTYVKYGFGGAAIFKEYAEKAGKTVINTYEN